MPLERDTQVSLPLALGRAAPKQDAGSHVAAQRAPRAARARQGLRAGSALHHRPAGPAGLGSDHDTTGEQFQCNLKGRMFTKMPYVFLQDTLEKVFL